MDTLSHGLWAAAAYKGINLKAKKKLNIWWAAFWGVFPDFFSFVPLFFWIFWSRLIEGNNVMQGPEFAEPAVHDSLFIMKLTNALYNLSHSLFVFFIIIIAIIAIRKFIQKKSYIIPWVMGGWLIHILIDIPTHSYKFYPTPFLWPISGYKFDGYAWGNATFMVVNYSLLFLVYFIFFLLKKKFKKSV